MNNKDRLKPVLVETAKSISANKSNYFDVLANALSIRGVVMLDEQTLARAIARSSRLEYSGSPEFYLRFAADIIETLTEGNT